MPRIETLSGGSTQTSSAAAEHIQPSLDVKPWDTRSAQLASSSHRHDKR